MEFALVSSRTAACALPAQRPPRRSFVVHASVIGTPDGPDTVTLNCDGQREKIRLINRRIHLGAVKDVFNITNVKINGQIEPVDADGFTLSEFPPHTMISVSGQPVLGLARLAAEMSALRGDLDRLAKLPEDIKAIKRLVAEITYKTCEEPDVVGADGYAWGTWKESMDMARDIIHESTKHDLHNNTSMDGINQLAIS